MDVDCADPRYELLASVWHSLQPALDLDGTANSLKLATHDIIRQRQTATPSDALLPTSGPQALDGWPTLFDANTNGHHGVILEPVGERDNWGWMSEQ